jgi:hypothetical protein
MNKNYSKPDVEVHSIIMGVQGQLALHREILSQTNK